MFECYFNKAGQRTLASRMSSLEDTSPKVHADAHTSHSVNEIMDSSLPTEDERRCRKVSLEREGCIDNAALAE